MSTAEYNAFCLSFAMNNGQFERKDIDAAWKRYSELPSKRRRFYKI